MKAIVSVLGKDSKGIIANVSMTLFKAGINIVDISQTVMHDYFTMIMMVELENDYNLEKINENLQGVAAKMGVEIRLQHEDIFNSMHRI